MQNLSPSNNRFASTARRVTAGKWLKIRGVKAQTMIHKTGPMHMCLGYASYGTTLNMELIWN